MKTRLFSSCNFSLFLFAASFASHAGAQAQQSIGTVEIQNANVSGALEVTNGRAVLVGSAAVTAREHTAELTLSRGGSVHVCATSGLHLTSGKSTKGPVPLMMALDRGAIEVQMKAIANDVILTPDLRFTTASEGPLDLQLRVTKNGDTCVDNRGAKAPTLHIADQFGEASYELHAGQHVLFEHGNLKEVVDHESSECGCPAESGMSVADALLSSGTSGAARTAAEEHPFPVAVSTGLAPPSATPQASAGVIHSQVSATLNSNEMPDSTTVPAAPSAETPSASSSLPSGTTPAPDATQPPDQAPQAKGLFHSVGRFFRRIFGGG